jgi:hypothetical protein
MNLGAWTPLRCARRAARTLAGGRTAATLGDSCSTRAIEQLLRTAASVLLPRDTVVERARGLLSVRSTTMLIRRSLPLLALLVLASCSAPSSLPDDARVDVRAVDEHARDSGLDTTESSDSTVMGDAMSIAESGLDATAGDGAVRDATPEAEAPVGDCVPGPQPSGLVRICVRFPSGVRATLVPPEPYFRTANTSRVLASAALERTTATGFDGATGACIARGIRRRPPT